MRTCLARLTLLLVLGLGELRAEPYAPVRPTDRAADALPPELRGVGVDIRPGASLPLDVEVTDEAGRRRLLGTFFGRKPVVLVFVFFSCPVLCGELVAGTVRALRPLRPSVGRDFDVLIFSIDPRDSSVRAAAAEARALAGYGRAGAADGTHFVTADADAIRRVTERVGFRFVRDERTGSFRHVAGVTIMTPDGRVSRYLAGLEPSPRDLQLALAEASEGRLGSAVTRTLLYCYEYDAASGRYTPMVMRLVRIAGALVAATMAVLLAIAYRRDARRQARVGA